ncbi:MAG: lipoprotein signal peptidase [Herpetosiphonaceae bacterium]|nr:MAG: lipoprotein signal peptidase [Herpetosiphonaceae bacterium]
MRRLYPFLITLFLVVILDQATKWWALEQFWRSPQPPDSILVIPGLLEFTPVENRGVAFGLFRGYGLLLALLVVIILVVIAVKNWQEFISAPPLVKIPLGMIAGGGIGNMIDRAHLSFVVDFVRIPALPIFQVFNLADAAITIGGATLVLMLFQAERRQAPREAQTHHDEVKESRVNADERG